MTHSLFVQDYEIGVRGRLFKRATNKDEWQKDIPDLPAFTKALRAKSRIDIFDFLERPAPSPVKHAAYWEWESFAVLPISSYAHWYGKQINEGTRRAIRRAAQAGVEVRTVPFDDELVAGICGIYNESPVRQGRRFPHYRKPFEQVKKENATYPDKAEFLGAYYKGELVGFLKLVCMETYAVPMQILSLISHRDKKVTNALLGKGVELCAQKGLANLYYYRWQEESGLGEFKRRNGFERVDLRRYYVPVSIAGSLALKWKLHRELHEVIPARVAGPLKQMRARVLAAGRGSLFPR